MTQLPFDQLTSSRRLPSHRLNSKLNRRTALKLMAGGAAAVVLPSTATIAGQSADAGFTGSPLSPAPLSASSSASMIIEIFTGTATPEDTVLLSSTTSHPLMIKQFAPGLIALGGQMVDLNQILTKDGLMIGVGAMHAAAVTMQQSKSAMSEYLVVDALVHEVVAQEAAVQEAAVQEPAVQEPAVQKTVQKIGDGTEVVTLNAVVDANGTAVVYIPQTDGVTGLA